MEFQSTKLKMFCLFVIKCKKAKTPKEDFFYSINVNNLIKLSEYNLIYLIIILIKKEARIQPKIVYVNINFLFINKALSIKNSILSLLNVMKWHIFIIYLAFEF